MCFCTLPVSVAPVKLRLVSAVLLDLVCIAQQYSLKVPANEQCFGIHDTGMVGVDSSVS